MHGQRVDPSKVQVGEAVENEGVDLLRIDMEKRAACLPVFGGKIIMRL